MRPAGVVELGFSGALSAPSDQVWRRVTVPAAVVRRVFEHRHRRLRGWFGEASTGRQ